LARRSFRFPDGLSVRQFTDLSSALFACDVWTRVV
jgi:hypothetical protein